MGLIFGDTGERSEKTVKLNKRQFDQLDGKIGAVDGAVNKLAEAVAPVEDNESISAKLGVITELIRNQQSTVDLGPVVNAIEAGFASVVEAIAKLSTPLPPPQPEPLEVKFVFIVKDDHEPVNFSLALGEVKDAEGNVIPDAQLDIAVASDNPDAVAVSFDAAAKTGSVSFGAPGQANVTANVSSGGKLLGTGAAAFTVTVGDPASISGVGINFDGLTEA